MVSKRKRGNESVDVPQEFAASNPNAPTCSEEVPKLKRARKRAKILDTASVTAPVDTPYSSSSAPVIIPSPAKKPRKKKDPKAPLPEKRLAQFKPRCPQNIRDRLERVRSQRFYMVARKRNEGEFREEFNVLGSTGNVYTVIIDRLPKCDCPDASKGNHCKHILFIMTKVLQVSQTSGLWYQKALLTSELETVFNEAPAAPNAVTNPRLQEAFAHATGKAPAEPPSNVSKNRIPCEGDDCPICYDTMYQVAETELVFCDECRNAVHQACFQQWRVTAVKSGKSLTCVWCRSPWAAGAAGAGAGASGSGAGRTGGAYLNLANEVGISTVRDTSTYYHGPKKGQRYYGYRDYDDDAHGHC